MRGCFNIQERDTGLAQKGKSEKDGRRMSNFDDYYNDLAAWEQKPAVSRSREAWCWNEDFA
jgi:hypothetical protein